jgi:hypothetical protein
VVVYCRMLSYIIVVWYGVVWCEMKEGVEGVEEGVEGAAGWDSGYG